MSTNLTEISDWLTKIIVGVGLVEARRIFDRLSQLSANLGGKLFDGAAGSRLIIPAVIIAGALLGFLYAYLFTLLRIAELVAHTDAELGNAGGAPRPLLLQLPDAELGSAGTTLPETVVPMDVQHRKQAFSDYIQEKVAAKEKDLLDRVALALGVQRSDDLATQRLGILDAVARRVDVPDATASASAMTEVSNQLNPITNRNF